MRTLAFRSVLGGLSLLVLGACTYVPFDADRTVTRAFPQEGTRNAQSALALTGGTEDGVVLAPLEDGNDALGARLRMIATAERSIDISTFLIKPDIAGSLIWLALYDAAERGIRVRLLFDDVFTTARDDQIATLNAHPNVEIRVFNPLSRRSSTAVNFLLDFRRVNRRMHNKSMVVDGALAILGGRNIADEYYQINTSNEFADFDLFIGGKPVAQVSEAFDLYWNDPWSVPFEAFETGDDSALQDALAIARTRTASKEVEIYQRAVNSQYLADLKAGRVPRYQGRARVVVDDPEKLRKAPGKGPYVVGETLYQTLARARKEVLIITPYFVPEDYGARFFEGLVRRNVRVRIVTNSLGATNHAYVHGGYAPYRDQMLKSGVEFLEVRSDAPKLLGGGDAPLTMHTKLAIVDGETLFVGSTNVDPRSIRQNTEIGIVIESPALAGNILSRINAFESEFAFRVLPGQGRRPIWRYEGAGQDQTFATEPGASTWRRIIARVTRWLPVESQL